MTPASVTARMADEVGPAHGRSRPWRRATVWLVGLAVFFYASYGFANWAASRRLAVPSVVLGWETAIPFLPWTILPYWSINLFYGASLFVCSTKAELDRHASRLLTAQLVAVACFLAFPLRFSFARPEAAGLPGFLFDVLAGFDRPFNQAPSLHIALLVILWTLYARHLSWPWRAALHVWFALIGLSVLTTYQHHVFDVPTGAKLGFLCLWAWPDAGASPLREARWATDPKRRRISLAYAAGGLALAGVAGLFGSVALGLLWPALSLFVVAAAYAGLGPAAFQKGRDGRMSLAAQVLLAPYLAAAWANSRGWTRRDPEPVEVGGGIWIGRFPGRRVASRFAVVIDCAAELPRAFAHPNWRAVPMLDLVRPPEEALAEAADGVERARAQGGPILVCCALGFGRSAAVLARWLVRTGRAESEAAALRRLRAVRPAIGAAHPASGDDP